MPYFPACHPKCSLRADLIGAEASDRVTAAYHEGISPAAYTRTIIGILGYNLDRSIVRRHITHFREEETELPAETAQTTDTPAKVSDMDILDSIIAAGARNSKSWKPTIADTLKAMDMKLKLGGENPFQAMLDAMDSALNLADGDLDKLGPAMEARDALGLPDELDDPEEEVA